MTPSPNIKARMAGEDIPDYMVPAVLRAGRRGRPPPPCPNPQVPAPAPPVGALESPVGAKGEQPRPKPLSPRPDRPLPGWDESCWRGVPRERRLF
jgi:hypothetical protein